MTAVLRHAVSSLVTLLGLSLSIYKVKTKVTKLTQSLYVICIPAKSIGRVCHQPCYENGTKKIIVVTQFFNGILNKFEYIT